jgi:8-oxo-dGTP pyrophosphatase MutT (NUDIX family)
VSLSLPAAERRAWIRERLEPLTSAPPDPATARSFQETNPHLAALSSETPALAAVLVALVERPEGLTVIFTTRPDNMRSHAGQVAFPGGRADPGESPAETALREAEEEIGLPPDQVTLAGLGDPYQTGSGYLIVPVVGFVPPDLPLRPNPGEVADIFETPLEFLMDPANHVEHQIQGKTGETFSTIAMTWEDRFIWGATANMLRLLHERLFGPSA